MESFRQGYNWFVGATPRQSTGENSPLNIPPYQPSRPRNIQSRSRDFDFDFESEGFEPIYPPNSATPRYIPRLSSSSSSSRRSSSLNYQNHHHCSQCALKSRIEYETGIQVHTFGKERCKELTMHCRTPIDLVMYKYEGGSILRPNGYFVDSYGSRLVAVVISADDPNEVLEHKSLPDLFFKCCDRNQCNGVIITNYNKWAFIHLPWKQEKAKEQEINQQDDNGKKLFKTLRRVDDVEYTVHRDLVKNIRIALKDQVK